VGEALVGNEAVDQLVKFNQALADHSDVQTNPRLIDGIVLTKFDTIDDKVRGLIRIVYSFFSGWSRSFHDLYHRTTDRLRRHRPNLQGSEDFECKCRCQHSVEVIYVFPCNDDV
jgi:hypothetical protein